jgi:MFS family permease
MTARMAPPLKRHIVAVLIGNALEFYDFTTYSYFATQIGLTFFPSKSPLVSLLASLAAFGIGFAGRPVGGILIGAYGDRAGRRPAMVLSFALMGVAILGLALMPSYAAIGVVAPVGVVILRLLQGIAVGGDVGPTTAFLLEAAPEERRGLYTALQYSSQGVSTLLGGVAGYVLSQLMDAQSLQDYGWRIAFLLGAVILPIGYALRRALPETLHDDVPEPQAAADDGPATVRWRTVVLGFLMLGSATIGFYTLAFLNTYAHNFLGMRTDVSFKATIVFGVANIIFSTLAGQLSDRYGRKPLMLIPRVLMALAIWPAFALLIANRDATTLLLVAFGLGALSQMGVTGFVALSEALPKRARSATLATTYALAISIFGGTTQFAETWLIGVTGSIMVPAWYLLAATVVGVVVMAMMDETAPLVRARAEERAWTTGKVVGREEI